MNDSTKYSPLKKSVLVVLNMFFVTLLGVTLMVGVVLMRDTNGDIKQLMNNSKFSDSNALKEQMRDEIYKVVDYIELKMLLETNGVFDEDKMINVLDYSQDDYIPGQSKDALNYRLGDLLNWNKENDDYLDWIYFEGDGGNYSSFADPDWQEAFQELYQPNGYEGVEDFAKENGSNMQQCYSALALALNTLPKQVSDYYNNGDQYNPKESNIRYEVTDTASGEVFSNGGINTIKGKSQVISESYNGYDVKIGVDTSFPVKDSFYYANLNYNKFGPYLNLVFGGIIVGLIGALISICWLTTLTGHGKDKPGISLLAIDRVSTEILIFIWGCVAVAMGYLIADFVTYFFYDYSLLYMCIIGSCILGANALFLIAYLSLVRIIKAKTFISNSLCHKLKMGLIHTVRNSKVTKQIIILFGGYLLVNFILSLQYWWGGFGFFFSAIFNIVVGISLYKDAISRQKVLDGIRIIASGNLDYKLNISQMRGSNHELAVNVNQIGEGLQKAVESSMKNERTKADLITNVSHDIKTPLTSIVNYVDLLKREEIEDERLKGYINVLDNKSQRLKQLTEDLVEASKISSGNITLELIHMDFNELLQQTIGEFEDKFQARNLELVLSHPEDPVVIEGDGRRVWRIIENLFNNVCKYAMPHTRVYVELIKQDGNMLLSIKNVSEHALNIRADELTERFIRGDVSRSTEGSGLGLSIAKNLTQLQKGEFEIYLDGDLFKVMVEFQLIK
ncbi:histidine kinase dimerization/phospho-acceptor domain-containing protein [Lachnospiraceae bacterium LCP25S3_G4]